MTLNKANGAVLWRGPSLLDSAPIIAIATGIARNSENAKTGAMLQTWILREGISPGDAVKNGADSSICGTCPHRGVDGAKRTCYVLMHNAPRAVWSAYCKGNYPEVATTTDLVTLGRGRSVRLGAYGDPAVVPVEVWSLLVQEARNRTGYTHAWRTAPQALATYCMASVDSAEERAEAGALGWRTFRVSRSRAEVSDVTAALRRGEVICPASEERGFRTTCAQCGLCRGAGPKPDIVILAHGIVGRGLVT